MLEMNGEAAGDCTFLVVGETFQDWLDDLGELVDDKSFILFLLEKMTQADEEVI